MDPREIEAARRALAGLLKKPASPSGSSFSGKASPPASAPAAQSQLQKVAGQRQTIAAGGNPFQKPGFQYKDPNVKGVKGPTDLVTSASGRIGKSTDPGRTPHGLGPQELRTNMQNEVVKPPPEYQGQSVDANVSAPAGGASAAPGEYVGQNRTREKLDDRVGIASKEEPGHEFLGGYQRWRMMVGK